MLSGLSHRVRALGAPNRSAETIVIDAYGSQLAVTAPDAMILRTLVDGLPRGWVSEASHHASTAHFLLARDGDGYRIRDENGPGRRFADGDVAIWMLRRQIRDTVCSLVTGAVPLRAGIVTYGEQGVLLPADAFAGTSTLVEALVRAGCERHSDEVAILTTEGEIEVSRGERGPTPTRTGIPARLVAFTVYKPGADWLPRRLSAGEGVAGALAYLAGSERSAQVLTTLRRALDPAILLKGDRGDANSTARALIDMLDAAYG